jgi:hypothetical protein
MRDWRGYVEERLGSLRIEQGEAEDVATELTEHLEECYSVLCGQGLPEKEAYAQTCAKAGNWDELRRKVNSAKREGTMTDRVKQIWVPSLVTLLASFAVMAVVIWAGIQPIISHPGEPRGVILYLPWLLVLPLIGAAGAYLSRRAEGNGWRVYLAGGFPALAIATIFLVTFPFAFFVDSHVVPGFKFSALAAMTVSWVILPGIALCIGVALEGVRKTRTGEVSRG